MSAAAGEQRPVTEAGGGSRGVSKSSLPAAAQQSKRDVKSSPDVIHGKRYTYTGFGCRCDDCRAANAAYQRASGGNRRIGARGESKRRADEKLRHPCERCREVLVVRDATLCLECRHWQQQERRREIERRWTAGETLREIAAALETSANAIGVTLVYMRADGDYDVPPRPPGGLRRRKAVAA